MDKELLAPLNVIEASLDTLVRSLTTTQTYSAGPKAARDLVAADDELQKALGRLKSHQENLLELQRLRAEAESLNAKVKDTVLTCVKLRKELGDINYSILEDSDEEEDETNPVDYEMLLAFATRIGKHNAIAAQEAEKLVEQQYLAAKKGRELDRAGSRGDRNGINFIDADNQTETRDGPSCQAQQTQQVNEQISEFQNRRNWDRAQITAPFPNAEILRIGELGRLQIQKEQNGEDYSDAHVEALVMQSELKRQVSEPQQHESSPERQILQTVSRQTGERRPVERRPDPKPKKTLDLDFPGGDDEDDGSDVD